MTKSKPRTTRFMCGDLFEALGSSKLRKSTVYIPHVVNDQGAWGAGFVVPLKRQFPKAAQAYRDWCDGKLQKHIEDPRLGSTQYVAVNEKPKIVVCNMMAQTLGGERPLFYNHLAACMQHVAETIQILAEPAVIMCPAFGGGLAGGDFNFIVDLIKDTWTDVDIPVTVFYLRGLEPRGWQPIEQDDRFLR